MFYFSSRETLRNEQSKSRLHFGSSGKLKYGGCSRKCIQEKIGIILDDFDKEIEDFLCSFFEDVNFQLCYNESIDLKKEKISVAERKLSLKHDFKS